MLTTADDFHVLSLPVNGYQEELLHHFQRDGGEAAQPIGSWVLLLALLEDMESTALYELL